MKLLYLLRHAKSSWDDPALGDFDRPLNARGRKAAQAMARHLQERGIRPALVLCSAARRTRETYDALLPALSGTEVLFENGLYETTRTVLYDRLTRLEAGLPSVLLIGHNPSLERLAQFLVADDQAGEAWDRLCDRYPTGTLTVLESPAEDWAGLAPASCRLLDFVRPADLEA